MFSMNSLHGPGAAVPDGFHQEQRLRFSSCRTVLDSVQELQEFRRQQNRKLRKTASQNSQCSSSKCLSQFLDLPHHHFIPPFPHSRSKPWEMHCRHIKRFRLNIRIWFFFMVSGVNHWNRLLRAVVESPLLEMFQKGWIWHSRL